MGDEPPPLTGQHRRQLLHFSRWLASLARDDATLLASASLARRIDRNGMTPADRDACLEAMDELLSGCWDRPIDAE